MIGLVGFQSLGVIEWYIVPHFQFFKLICNWIPGEFLNKFRSLYMYMLATSSTTAGEQEPHNTVPYKYMVWGMDDGLNLILLRTATYFLKNTSLGVSYTIIT